MEPAGKCTTTSRPTPPGPVSMRAAPPEASASWETMARPRPNPSPAAPGGRQNRSNAWARCVVGHARALVDDMDVDSLVSASHLDRNRRTRGGCVEGVRDRGCRGSVRARPAPPWPSARAATRSSAVRRDRRRQRAHVSVRSATIAPTSMSATSCGAASRRARTKRDCTRRPRRAVSFTAASSRGRSSAATRGLSVSRRSRSAVSGVRS